jgi:isoleucyl-tRNA synthetase
VFTADEIWENLPADDARPAFVHLSLLPKEVAQGDETLAANWEKLYEVRDQVLQRLEEARIGKQIGSSLEARVQLSASGELFDLLKRYNDELRYLFIVSQVEVLPGEDNSGIVVKVTQAEGKKCERCWNYSTRVGESQRYPEVCERCVIALDEIERETATAP